MFGLLMSEFLCRAEASAVSPKPSLARCYVPEKNHETPPAPHPPS